MKDCTKAEVAEAFRRTFVEGNIPEINPCSA